MLRVAIEDSANTLRVILQGRLVGEEAGSARSLMTRYRAGIKLAVDLSDVTFVDTSGEDLLSFFGRFDAVFIADTSYSRYICERLHLRVAKGEPLGDRTASPSDTTDMQGGQAHGPLVND